MREQSSQRRWQSPGNWTAALLLWAALLSQIAAQQPVPAVLADSASPASDTLWVILLAPETETDHSLARTTAGRDVARLVEAFQTFETRQRARVMRVELQGERADSEILREEISRIRQNCAPQDTILFIYIGAAFADENSPGDWRLALTPDLTSGTQGTSKGLRPQDLHTWLSALPSQKIALFMDLLVTPVNVANAREAAESLAAPFLAPAKPARKAADLEVAALRSKSSSQSKDEEPGRFSLLIFAANKEEHLESPTSPVSYFTVGLHRALAEDLADALPSGDTDGRISIAEAGRRIRLVFQENWTQPAPETERLIYPAGHSANSWFFGRRPERLAVLQEWRTRLSSIASQGKMDPRLLVEARMMLDGEMNLSAIPMELRGDYLALLGRLCRENIGPEDFAVQRAVVLRVPLAAGAESENSGSFLATLWRQIPLAAKIATLLVLLALILYIPLRYIFLRMRHTAPPAENAASAASGRAAAPVAKKGGKKGAPPAKPAPIQTSIRPVSGPGSPNPPSPPSGIRKPAAAAPAPPPSKAMAPAPAPSAARPAISTPPLEAEMDHPGDDEDAGVAPPSIADLKARALGSAPSAPPPPVISPKGGDISTSPGELDDELDLGAGASARATAPAAPGAPPAPPPPHPAEPPAPGKSIKQIDLGVDLDLDAPTVLPGVTPISIAPLSPARRKEPSAPPAVSAPAVHTPTPLPLGPGGASREFPSPPPLSPGSAGHSGPPPSREMRRVEPADLKGYRPVPLSLAPGRATPSNPDTPTPRAMKPVISPGVLPAVIRAWDLEWTGPVGRSRFRFMLGGHIELGRPARTPSATEEHLFISLLPVGEDGKPDAQLISMLSRQAFALDLTTEGVRLTVNNKASAHVSQDPLRPYWDWDNLLPASQKLITPDQTLWISPHFGERLAPISIRCLREPGASSIPCCAEMRFDVTFPDLVGLSVLLAGIQSELKWGGDASCQLAPGVGEGPKLYIQFAAREEGLVITPSAEAKWIRRQGRMLDDHSLLLGGASAAQWDTEEGEISLKLTPHALPRITVKSAPAAAPPGKGGEAEESK